MASKRSKLVVIVSEKETWSGFGRLVLRQGAPGRHVWQLIPTQERIELSLNLTLWHRNWPGQAISPSLVRQCARIQHRRWVLTLLQSYRPKIRRGVRSSAHASGSLDCTPFCAAKCRLPQLSPPAIYCDASPTSYALSEEKIAFIIARKEII